jgi:hypothetical protein
MKCDREKEGEIKRERLRKKNRKRLRNIKL